LTSEKERFVISEWPNVPARSRNEGQFDALTRLRQLLGNHPLNGAEDELPCRTSPALGGLVKLLVKLNRDIQRWSELFRVS
jgi:hypothetical protein